MMMMTFITQGVAMMCPTLKGGKEEGEKRRGFGKKIAGSLSACRDANAFLGSPWIEHGTFRSSV